MSFLLPGQIVKDSCSHCLLAQNGAAVDEKYFSKNFQFLSLGAMAYIGKLCSSLCTVQQYVVKDIASLVTCMQWPCDIGLLPGGM